MKNRTVRFFFVLSAIFICLMMANPFVLGAESKKPSVLFLASESSLGGMTSKPIDEYFEKKMTADGYELGFSTIQSITYDQMKEFNTVILYMQPVYWPTEVNAMEAVARFRELEDAFLRYVNEGGGLFINIDPEYETWREELYNPFLEKIGAFAYPQRLVETNQANIDKYPLCNAPIYKFIPASDNPILKGIEEVWLPYYSRPIKIDENWAPLLESSPSSHTENLEQTVYPDLPTQEGNIPIAAARTLGKGRIVLLDSHTSWTILEGSIMMFGSYCFEKGEGYEFFRNVIEWLSNPSLTGNIFGGFVANEQEKLFSFAEFLEKTTWFKHLPDDAQAPEGKWMKGIVGVKTNLSSGTHSVKEFCDAAKENGYNFIIFAEDEPSAENFQKLIAECDANSDNTFIAIPGVEFASSTCNQLSLICFGKTIKWPFKDRSAIHAQVVDNIPTMLTHGISNEQLPSDVGAFGGMEIAGYDENGKLVMDGIDSYSMLQSYDWFEIPVSIHRIKDPAQLTTLTGFMNYVKAPNVAGVVEALNMSMITGGKGRTTSYISEGPKIDEFWMGGDGVVVDPWEGRYYIWPSTDDVATINVSITNDNPITSVTVYQDEFVFRRFSPNANNFSTQIRKLSDNAGRNYWMVVEDSAGNKAVSRTLRTRDLYFWAHEGGDRLNTYANNMFDSPTGGLYILGHLLDSVGMPLFDIGRGDGWYGFHGQPKTQYGWAAHGTEIYANIQGGVDHPLNPMSVVYTNDESGKLTPAIQLPIPDRRGYEIAAGDCQIIKDFDTREKEKIFSETFQSDRYPAHQSEKIRSKSTYTVYRYQPGHFAYIIYDREIEFLQDVKLATNSWEPEIMLLAIRSKAVSADALTTVIYSNENGEVVHENVDFKNNDIIASGKLGPYGFVGYYPDPVGNIAIYALDDNKYDFVIKGRHPMLRVGYKRPGEVIPAGTKIKARLMLVYTASNEKPDGSYFEDIWRKYGVRQAPEYTLTLEKGSVKDNTFVLRLVTDQFGVKGTLDNAGFGERLPIEVNGVDDQWEAGFVNLTTGEIKMHATTDSTLYLVVDDAGKLVNFYAGNLVCAYDGRMVLNLVKTEGKWQVVAHNPTYKEITTALWTADVAPVLLQWKTEATFAPGETKVFDIE